MSKHTSAFVWGMCTGGYVWVLRENDIGVGPFEDTHFLATLQDMSVDEADAMQVMATGLSSGFGPEEREEYAEIVRSGPSPEKHYLFVLTQGDIQ